MKEFLTNILNTVGLAWWVEITTDNPRCVYYFGPFSSEETATAHQSGYIEDLEQEGAQNIVTHVKRCKPTQLTLDDDLGKSPSTGAMSSAFSA